MQVMLESLLSLFFHTVLVAGDYMSYPHVTKVASFFRHSLNAPGFPTGCNFLTHSTSNYDFRHVLPVLAVKANKSASFLEVAL